MDANPILLEIFKHRFSTIAEEMGVTLKRTAFSPNIKERRDFSCAVFDKDGRMVSQAAHIPVHLGSMPLSVASAIAQHRLREGDMVIVNNPFNGGTHLPDITMVAPVYTGNERPDFYVANRAHHADIGGMSAGSMPMSTSIFQEGLIIGPARIIQKGVRNDALMQMILDNVRTPAEREGDFTAQMMANLIGIRRIKSLIAAHGGQTVSDYAAHLIDYSETITRKTIAAIPDGAYRFTDVMDDDGQGRQDIRISVQVDIQGDTAVIDFSDSDDQVGGCINTVRAVTLSSVLYALRSLIPEDIPANAGCAAPITVKTRPGSIVDARFPAAVAAGNVETAQRIVDVLFGALGQALPDRVPAASQGTMNNLTIGGINPATGRPFTYYETIAGGMGACGTQKGESAVHSHMTNTLNTPVEAFEFSYPMQVVEYRIREDSGGKGRFHGGDGLIRKIKVLVDSEVTVLSERRMHGPYGLSGGEPGRPGRNRVNRNKTATEMPGKFHVKLSAGDSICIETPGGGGFGKAKDENMGAI